MSSLLRSVTGQTTIPQIGETHKYKESQFTGAEPTMGTRARVGKPNLSLMNFWKLSMDNLIVKNSRETQVQRGPPNFGTLPGALPGPHTSFRRKIPSGSSRGRGKRAILKYSRALCSPQGLPSRETILA